MYSSVYSPYSFSQVRAYTTNTAPNHQRLVGKAKCKRERKGLGESIYGIS